MAVVDGEGQVSAFLGVGVGLHALGQHQTDGMAGADGDGVHGSDGRPVVGLGGVVDDGGLDLRDAGQAVQAHRHGRAGMVHEGHVDHGLPDGVEGIGRSGIVDAYDRVGGV